jgi:hypothetical protein
MLVETWSCVLVLWPHCGAVQAATHYDLNANGIVSVEEFRLALNEYEDACAEGGKPEWF